MDIYLLGTPFKLLISMFLLAGCTKTASVTQNISLKDALVFYIDSQNGDDKNNGASADKAWKSLNKINGFLFIPGDSILFKCGGSWDGQLVPKGSGSDGLPIVFSSYGSGNKPVLNGKGTFDQVIQLNDLSYIEVYNLEITNTTSLIGNRLGVLVKNNGTAKKHIYLRNLYIHDVVGDYSFTTGKSTGGIGIVGTTGTLLNDIRIEDCEIANVSRVGIYSDLLVGTAAVQGNRPITNFVIRRNKIHHCAGDGVIVRYAYRPLIEFNTVYENHDFSETLVGYGVALWCRSTDEATFQYNEIYNTRGSKDGEAFDADEDAYRTVVQYNYSHDNEGGFMLFTSSSTDAIVRYNVSVNDGGIGLHVFDFPVWAAHVRATGIIHNNTVVLPTGSNAVIVDEALTTANFYNNIFCNKGSGALNVFSGGLTATFGNNLYYGYSPLPVTDATALLSDPLLIAPFSYSVGVSDPNNTNGFKLKANSPCLGKAVSTAVMLGNYWTTNAVVDFWGNAIKNQPLNIGAFQN